MTELAPYQAPPTALDTFTNDAREVYKVASVLANTSFVPKAFQGKPDEITGAILAGQEIGMPPMTALRAIDVIQGTPCLSANAQRGLAQAHGIEFDLIESTATRCVMRARRPGTSKWTEVTWDIDRAKKMELTGKKNWREQPQSMLIARATSELCRLEAADVLFSMPHSQEELRDADRGTGTAASTTAAATGQPTTTPAPREQKRTAQREPIPATIQPPLAEPPLDPPTPALAPPPPRALASTPDTTSVDPGAERVTRPLGQRNAGREITQNTRKAIMAALGDLNIRSRVDRLARLSGILGWEVSSTNLLTEDEGRQALHGLRNDVPVDGGVDYDPWAGMTIVEPAPASAS